MDERINAHNERDDRTEEPLDSPIRRPGNGIISYEVFGMGR